MRGSIFVAFATYLLCMIAVGLCFRRKSSDASDFFLGNRTVGGWTSAFSATASDMSSWVMMGLPAAIYFGGLSSVWIAVGLAIGTYLNWLLIAGRLRCFTAAAGNSVTLPQYLQNRFFSSSVVLRSVCAVFIFLLYLIYTASAFRAGGRLFTYVLGYDYRVAVAIGAFILLAYTFMGGFLAVSWTNQYQLALMLGAMVMLPLLAISATPEPGATLTHLLGSFLRSGGDLPAASVVSGFAWGLGYFGMPHILIHFMGMRSSRMALRGRRISLLLVTLCLTSSVAVGLTGRVYFSSLREGYHSFAAAEYLFADLAMRLAPGLGAGILLCAILAAAMSTADSQLLVTASVFANDFYKTLINPNASEKQMMQAARGAVLAISVLAYLLALSPAFSVMSLVSYAWAGFGATLGPAVLLSLFWRRMTIRGALAGVLAGGCGVLLWELHPALAGTGIYSLLPGFLLGTVCCVVGSLLDAPPPPEVQQLFEQALAQLESEPEPVAD